MRAPKKNDARGSWRRTVARDVWGGEGRLGWRKECDYKFVVANHRYNLLCALSYELY